MSYKFNPFSGNFDIVGSASGGTGDPGGSTTQVQFNDAGVFGGDSTFTFNKTTDTLTLANLIATASTTLSVGNLAFTGTGQRITGDTSNATVANRLMFQTSTVNGNTAFNLIPNGTSAVSQFIAYNNSDPTNASFARIRVSAGEIGIESSRSGTGTYLPMVMSTDGYQRVYLDGDEFILRQLNSSTNTSVSFNTTVQNALTLDSSGNLGVGVTPTTSGDFTLQVHQYKLIHAGGYSNNLGYYNSNFRSPVTSGWSGFFLGSDSNAVSLYVAPPNSGSPDAAVTAKQGFSVDSTTGAMTVCGLTATPVGGSTSARLLFGSTSGFGIYYGSGAPTVSAAKGSLYLRSDGTGTGDRMYVNHNGSTGWYAVTTAS